jgi:hypothetical protein
MIFWVVSWVMEPCQDVFTKFDYDGRKTEIEMKIEDLLNSADGNSTRLVECFH